MRPIIAIASALSCAFIAACSSSSPEPRPEPLELTARTLPQGDVIGFQSDIGAHVWRSIPFAAAPIGDLRWRAPRPVEPFEQRYEAVEFGPRCAQITNGLDEGEGLEPDILVGSEDCLTLDIYAPPGAENLPVMVWIHGGANVWGRSAAYDGSQLALDRDVIVIAIQYRLGPLGWFAHPALRESAQTEADSAASFALLDMIAALEWVQENAATFGGNPDQVTIFGESAGGHNVAGLLASPMAHDLFHGAIIQSGIVWSASLEEAESGNDYIKGGALEIADNLAGSAATAEDLRAAPLADVFAAYPDGIRDMPRMIADGVVLPEAGILETASTPGGFNNIPVITGTNRDEMRLYAALNPELVNRVSLLLWPKDGEAYTAMSDYPSRYWRAQAVDELANRLRSAGHENVWAYRFDWDEGGRLLVTDTGLLFGAAHSMEIPFVFNHFEFYGALDALLFTDGNASGRDAIAQAMGEEWGHFAYHGAPTDRWSPWVESGNLMRFDTPDDGGIGMFTGAENLDLILTDLAADTRLDQDQRCAVADELTSWSPDDAALIANRADC